MCKVLPTLLLHPIFSVSWYMPKLKQETWHAILLRVKTLIRKAVCQQLRASWNSSLVNQRAKSNWIKTVYVHNLFHLRIYSKDSRTFTIECFQMKFLGMHGFSLFRNVAKLLSLFSHRLCCMYFACLLNGRCTICVADKW